MSISLSLIIIVVTAIISNRAFNNPAFKGDLLFHPSSIKRSGQYHRFLTSGFIHQDLQHLGFNMLTLFFFGAGIEQVFDFAVGPAMGKTCFLLFYLSAIVFSSLHTYIRYQDYAGYTALGASGAVTAVVFASVVFDPWNWFIYPPVPAIVFAGLYIYYSNYMDKYGRDNIGHNAHLWGAIYGIAFTIVFFYFTQPALLEIAFQRLMQGPSWPF